MAKPHGRQLTITQQAVRLRQQFPDDPAPVVKAGAFVWSVTLQPTPMSVHYKVGIQYKHRQRPRVKVLTPALETRPRESLPHVYPGNELCLYYQNEFVGSEHFIANTIVPWVSEWLYFYEHWMSTGCWLGTEAPHGPGITKR
ncbi:hypothetical protein [Rhodococcus sp. UFZ-B548]|uniref:hypothetical protein n=1 Tax=Rhodococcus sp. UFZ-B548 TaxID=2742212 RepID=UPI0015F7507C|nr:hypothetical protein [Rhodococcus sp. UFZ-B548]